MAKLIALDKTNTAHRQALQMLLPPGPIWDVRTQPTLGALVSWMATEPKTAHNRFVDLVLEADPRTADELLEEWIEAWGLPSTCGDMPTDADAKRAMLAAKVAAQGGQSRAYYIAIAYAALDQSYRESGLEWVTIEERPYGVPFRVSVSRVGDRLNGEGAMHYWVLHLPAAESGTPTAEVLECLVSHWKPAHTSVAFAYDIT